MTFKTCRRSVSIDGGLFGGHTFSIDGVEFVSAFRESTVERFCILKSKEQLDFYMDLCRSFEGGAIVELGVASGGSTALLALLARPRRLVAVELNATPVDALARLIDERGLADMVHPVYGVNQADRARLAQIVGEQFGDDPLDLVIDDASHLLAETTSSFETLFPYLRPGGVYVIEDWNSAHLFADLGGALGNADALTTPLSPLLIELLLVRASSGDIVSEIRVGNLWATIRRGPAVIDPETFRIADNYVDHFGLLESVQRGAPRR